MKKVYDTNVIIDYPEVLLEDEVAITHSIIEELENLKRKNRLNYKIRKAIRNIIKRKESLKIIDDSKIPLKETDDMLIEVCLRNNYKLITQDSLLYLRGINFLKSIEYYTPVKDIYSGIVKYNLPDHLIDRAYNKGFINCDDIDIDLKENQFLDSDKVILRKRDDKLFKVDWEKSRYFISKDFKLNRQQLMAYDLLMDSTVPLVTIWGKYGTGKTSLAVRTALKMFNKDMYEKILVTRPKVEIGYKDEHLGILPGEVNEKYAPYLEPFKDNASTTQFQMLDVQPLSTIKGRDIKNTLFIIDEFSDISPDRVPQIIERVGKGSKLVLIGDPNQIDNPNLHKYYNGITFTCNNLKGESNFGCVKLKENERSETAMLGEKLRNKL